MPNGPPQAWVQPGQRAHPAGDGTPPANALAAGTLALARDPDDTAQHRSRRRGWRTARPLAADAGPTGSRLRLL